MSKKVKIQFVVTTPHQVVYKVSDDFQLNTLNVYEAIRDLSNYLKKDILIDFGNLADQKLKAGTAKKESVSIDFIEVKDSNNNIESFLESDAY